MKRILLIAVFCFLCLFKQVKACGGGVIDPIGPDDRWENDVTVLLDVEFGPGGAYEGIAEKVIEKLNAELVDIQLDIEYSEVNFGFSATVLPLIANGMTTQQALAEYNTQLIALQTGNPNKVIVTIDPSSSGFSGSGPNPICPDGGSVESCEDPLIYGGQVNLKSTEYDKLLTEAFAWFQDEYGATYEAEDVFMHELLHALGLKHLFGPYMKKQTFFDDVPTTLLDIKYQSIQPLMNPSRTSNAYGLTETDRNMIYLLYGEPSNKRASVNLQFCTGDEFHIVQGLNVAAYPVVGTKPAGTFIKRLGNKAIGKGTNLGVVHMFMKPGTYKLKVRDIPTNGGSFSNLEAEVDNPDFIGEKWVFKNKKGEFKLTDDPNKASKLVFKQDRSITIQVPATPVE